MDLIGTTSLNERKGALQRYFRCITISIRALIGSLNKLANDADRSIRATIRVKGLTRGS